MSDTDLHERLCEAIRERADQLDGGILAPEWVQALSWDEQVEAWQSVLDDSELLADHRPQEHDGAEPARCASDQDPFPCAEVARLASAYEVG